MSKKNILCVVVGLVGILSVLLLKTPIYGETQLMNKIYIMLMICYFVLDQFLLVMQIMKKNIKLSNAIRHYLLFFSVTAFMLMFVNRVGDSIIGAIDIQMSNSACFFASLLFVVLTSIMLTALKKLKY